MKKLVDLLTDEERDKLKNCYMVTSDNELCKLTQDEGDELTAENFIVLFATKEGFVVSTVEQMCYINPKGDDFDFSVGDHSDWFSREYAPEPVVEFLDEYLNKALYENKE